MYPNMTRQATCKAIKFAADNCCTKKDDGTSKSRAAYNAVIAVVKILFERNYFTYNGNIYRQNSGAKMGSPAVPQCANLYAIRDEIRVLKAMKREGMNVAFYNRFIDD